MLYRFTLFQKEYTEGFTAGVFKPTPHPERRENRKGREYPYHSIFLMCVYAHIYIYICNHMHNNTYGYTYTLYIIPCTIEHTPYAYALTLCIRIHMYQTCTA